MYKYLFESERLGFRKLIQKDKSNIIDMNSNSQVMKYFESVYSKQQSINYFNRLINYFKEHGYGMYAIELKESNEFIGIVGFNTANFDAYFTPCIEIGWKLKGDYFNNGYGTESARACLEYGFSEFNFQEVYSFTSLLNIPSINIMKKLNMKQLGYFCHPKVTEGHDLRKHIIYKISKQKFLSKR